MRNSIGLVTRVAVQRAMRVVPSYSTRLVALVIFINLIVYSMVAFSLKSSFQLYQDRAAATTLGTNLLVTQTIASEIDRIDMGLMAVVDEVARRQSSGGMDTSRLGAFLNRQKQRLPMVDGLRITDDRGDVVLSGGTVDILPQTSLVDREYFLRLRDDPKPQLVISRPLVSQISQKWVLVFARRLNLADGRFGGMVYAPVTIEHFEQMFGGQQVGRLGTVVLRGDASRDFDLLGRFPHAGFVGQTRVSDAFRATITASPLAGTYVSPHAGADNIRRIYSYHAVGTYPLITLVGLATDDILAEWYLDAAKLTALAAAFTLLTIYAARKILADRANRAKTRFLATMSHEMRTPLNAIVGFTQNLLNKSKDPEQTDKLEKIAGAADHLLEVINDILDMSKIEAGNMALSPEAFNIRTLLSGVMDQFAPQAAAHALDLRLKLGADLPEQLYGDALRLRQCLINYLGNAIKFTTTGSVTLKAMVDSGRDDSYLIRFEVQDTGIGIKPEALPRLFEAFEQVDQSITRQFGGTGLGLAVTKRLATLMGGAVGVSSVAGKGSTFWFTAIFTTVTAEIPAPIPPASVPINVAHWGDVRVLLAEDIPLNREVLLGMLTEIGLGVDFADNGQKAVSMASSRPYDLILMDMQMPVMDGLSATEAIRKIPGHATTPIIALTANAFTEDRKNCLNAGMNDFITKPIRQRQLHHALVKWLGKATQPAGPLEPESSPLNSSQADLVRGLFRSLNQDGIPCRLNEEFEPDKYLGYLAKFSRTYHDFLPRFQSLLSAGQMKEALRLAHSLCGVAVMLGLDLIHDRAADLEFNIDHGAVADDLLLQAHELAGFLVVICDRIDSLTISDDACRDSEQSANGASAVCQQPA